MAKAKLGINKKPIPVLIGICNGIYHKMLGNPNFPEPIPSMELLKKTIEDMENTYRAALDRGKTLKAMMYAAEKNLRFQMNQLAAYVDMVSKGKPELILSSGMSIASTSRARTPMTTVMQLRCLPTYNLGEARLRWKPVKHSRFFLIQFTQTPNIENSWKECGAGTKASITIKGLAKGEDYWFRVSVLGTLGQSAWSDPTQRIVG